MRPRRPLILTALGLAATLTLGALTGCTASEPSAQGSSTAPNQSSPAGTPATTAPSGGTPSASASPTPAPTTPAAASDFTPTVPAGATTVWPDNSMVPHLFFHSLVVDPKVAFGLKNKAKAAGYLDYMVTVDEFKKVLTQVYKNDYVLVSPTNSARSTPRASWSPHRSRCPRARSPSSCPSTTSPTTST